MELKIILTLSSGYKFSIEKKPIDGKNRNGIYQIQILSADDRIGGTPKLTEEDLNNIKYIINEAREA